jgi:5-(carboxyamino)imidazole ribonucleotide synthase
VIKPVLPGATIGVLGSGQLGRMFAMAARRMGYLVHTFSPETDTPTGQISDVEITGSYDDLDAVRSFAQNVDVVTFEFENIPSATIDAVAQIAPVRPSGTALNTTQHRLREKIFLSENGFPVAPFRHVRSLEELNVALADIGTPAVLKTAGFGYDGKGQNRIGSPADAAKAFEALGGQEAVLEAFVDFEREVSVVAARGMNGEVVNYGVLENSHRNHILDVTVSPARVSAGVAKDAVDMAVNLVEKLDITGVLCVEFFLNSDETLFVNELAPRPHNSGHLTIDAHVTSQFEQQLRAVCGLPLGSTDSKGPAAMANLLGDLWQDGTPDWVAATSFPNVKLHLYGKHEPRPGRKMGHVTACGPSTQEAVDLVERAREAMKRGR